eukprot:GCRY01003699.1.p1 GENE.GCRY01003699.1~~GCRY01003699.1.p1  ORF type:complete len:858 (+),score=257.39 GCRY01003699.1:235-2808(+)
MATPRLQPISTFNQSRTLGRNSPRNEFPSHREPTLLGSTLKMESTLPVFDSAARLIEDKHSKEMYERHSYSILKALKTCPDGLYGHHLSYIQLFLEHCCPLLLTQMDYFKKPVLMILDLLQKPLLRTRMSDRPWTLVEWRNTLTLLEPLLTAKTDPEIVIACLLVLHKFVKQAGQQDNAAIVFYDSEFVEDTFLQTKLLACLPLLLKTTSNASLLAEGLWLLHTLSKFPSLLRVMAKENALPLVLQMISVEYFDTLITTAIQFVWNFLECEDCPRTDDDDESLVAQIHIVLTYILRKEQSLRDKTIRNELVMLAILLASSPSLHHLFVEPIPGVLSPAGRRALPADAKDPSPAEPTDIGSLVQLLTLLGTIDELGHHTVGTAGVPPTFFLTNDDLDFECKRLVFCALVKLAENSDCLEVMMDTQLFASLLIYISPKSRHPVLMKWSAHQLHQFHSQVLVSLFTFVPLAPTEFQRLGGVDTLLSLVSPETLQTMAPESVTLALRILVISAAFYRPELGRRGGVTVLLGIVQVQSVGAEWRWMALAVLAAMCRDTVNNQAEFLNEGGVPIVMALLHAYDPQGPYAETTLIIAALDLIIAAVCANDQCLAAFLEDDGVCVLLDILERAPVFLRALIISCLDDMAAASQEVVDSLLEWQGATSTSTALQLLLDIWIAHNTQLGIPNAHLPNSDPKWSLRGGQPAPIDQAIPSSDESAMNVQSMTDDATNLLKPLVRGLTTTTLENILSTDYRMKIHLLISRLRVTADTVATLRPAQRIALLNVEQFQALCEGEVWNTMQEEFEAENMRPPTPDAQYLQDRLDANLQLGMDIQSEQLLVQSAKETDEVMEEVSYYRRYATKK